MAPRRVLESVERLQLFPLLGRVLLEFGRESIREVISGGYRIVCRVRGTLVGVLTVFHGSHLLRELSGDS